MFRLRTDAEVELLEKRNEELQAELINVRLQLASEQQKFSQIELRMSSGSGSPLLPTPPESPSNHSPSPRHVAAPLVSAPPAPPPPPAPGYLSSKKYDRKEDVPKKAIPKPRIPLKTINWHKLTHKQTEGTVWAEMHEEELYDILDLAEIEHVFASGVKNAVLTSGERASDSSPLIFYCFLVG